MGRSNSPVTVYVAAGQMEAEIVRGRLLAEDVPAILSYESLGQVMGITMDGLGEVRVQVPAALEARARQILATPPE